VVVRFCACVSKYFIHIPAGKLAILTTIYRVFHKDVTDFKYLYFYTTLDQVSYVTESFRFPGKAVVLLPAADWCCIYKLNKMATPHKKFRVASGTMLKKSVMIVHRQYQTRVEKDIPFKNLLWSGIKSLYRSVASTRKVGRASHKAVT
jgi:hypothetical protein